MFSVAAGPLRRGEDPVLLDLRQVRDPRLRPDRDGDQLRRQPQDRRQPRGHHASPPTAPARCRCRMSRGSARLDHDARPPRQPGLLRAPARRRLRGVRPDAASWPSTRAPCYMRTLRPDTEFLYNDDDGLQPRRLRGAQRGPRRGDRAAGYMVHEANKALELLDKAGISATLVDLYSHPLRRREAAGHRQRQRRLRHHASRTTTAAGSARPSPTPDRVRRRASRSQQMYVRRIPKTAKTPEEMLKMSGSPPRHREAGDEAPPGRLTPRSIWDTPPEARRPWPAGFFRLGEVCHRVEELARGHYPLPS